MSRPVPFYLALLVAALACAVNVRYSGFVAIYTDPSGYVSAGARWLSGDLQRPVPIQFQPQFPNHLEVGSPLGYRPAHTPGTDVVEYPLGLPVFLAACMAMGGEIAAYLFGPFMAGVLALTTYGVGAAAAGPWAGLLAAVLISVSPVTVRHSLFVSSDVACAAFWTIAWLMSFRARPGAAAAAGAGVTAAVMIRPNTAPLAVVIAALVLIGGSDAGAAWRRPRWGNAVIFGALAAIGPALVLWSNAVFFGSPLDAGYKGSAEFFRWAHVRPNLDRYPAWLLQVHSWGAFVGLAAPVLAFVAPSARACRGARVVALSALAFVLANLALIVPYLVFEQWSYLRFVLPGMVALFVLLAAAIAWTARTLWERGRWTLVLLPILLLPAGLAAWRGLPETQAALRDHLAARSVLVMGPYLRTALPRNVVLMAYTHSGSAAYYSNRPIVRLDMIGPDLDGVIALLRRQGLHPLLVIDEVIESPHLQRFFPNSAYWDLDWAPRASFAAFGHIWLMDPADRDPHRKGVRYPTDTLR